MLKYGASYIGDLTVTIYLQMNWPRWPILGNINFSGHRTPDIIKDASLKQLETITHSLLTHCGLVMPSGVRNLGQHCLMVSSHYLNQHWLLNDEVLWHSLQSNFTASASATIHYNEYGYYTLKITATSSRDHCVNILLAKQTLLPAWQFCECTIYNPLWAGLL